MRDKDAFNRPAMHLKHPHNQDQATMLELPRIILDLTGSHSQIVNRPLPKDNPAYFPKKIRLLLGRRYAKVELALSATWHSAHRPPRFSMNYAVTSVVGCGLRPS